MDTHNNNWKSFFSYYKWHIIFFVLVAICIAFVAGSCSTSSEADLTIGFIGTTYVHEQSFGDNQDDINKLLIDSSKDGTKSATFAVNRVNKQKEAIDLLEEAVELKAYNIYIAPKEAFLKHKNKSDFATMNKPSDNVGTLRDSSERIYAVSLDNNSYVSTILGIRDPKDMYIAVGAAKKEKLTDYEKNGLNIANYIVESRKNYN